MEGFGRQMKTLRITELIEKLEEMKKQLGNAEVYFEGENADLTIHDVAICEQFVDKVKYVLIY